MKKNKIIGLVGNPNVGKSTVFNALTGLHQHTGNWPGKTVENISGDYFFHDTMYTIYDLPGTYSLIPHSKEEECSRDFIYFGHYDALVVVCDAVCLERNLNLVLQTLEVCSKVIVVVNLMDEAKKKGIHINLKALSQELGTIVIGASARSGDGLVELMEKVEEVTKETYSSTSYSVTYDELLEQAITTLLPVVQTNLPCRLNARLISLKLLDDDRNFLLELEREIQISISNLSEVNDCLAGVKSSLLEQDIMSSEIKEHVVSSLIRHAENIAKNSVTFQKKDYDKRDRKIDKILTNKWTGIPIMLLLLMGIFWITMVGANYPSSILFDFFSWTEGKLIDFFQWIHAPFFLQDVLVMGIYHVLTWVISVMLPPMAIFFPLFTLLEDLGYLPRIAFNLDKYFRKCGACGKQALTMCMSFGCNAVGVMGTRIIDSPRERFIAILTNNFVPCNGRFPTLIAIITMFFVGFDHGPWNSFFNVLLLTLVILFGIFMTFFISKLLSKTLLKGVPSSFTLELPPFRRPQIGKTIVHSIFDRTLFVLGRAIAVAAPCGLLIWIMANISIGNVSLLMHCSNFLDPFAQLIGLDGVILMAFILGFPANEIVIPILLMAYMATGHITDFSNLFELKHILLANGWTWLTALCMMLFSLMHFPCSTTCLTIKKETKSLKWTFLSFLIPTLCGIIVCFVITSIVRLFGLV